MRFAMLLRLSATLPSRPVQFEGRVSEKSPSRTASSAVTKRFMNSSWESSLGFEREPLRVPLETDLRVFFFMEEFSCKGEVHGRSRVRQGDPRIASPATRGVG